MRFWQYVKEELQSIFSQKQDIPPASDEINSDGQSKKDKVEPLSDSDRNKQINQETKQLSDDSGLGDISEKKVDQPLPKGEESGELSDNPSKEKGDSRDSKRNHTEDEQINSNETPIGEEELNERSSEVRSDEKKDINQDQSGIPQTGKPSGERQEGELQDQSGIPQTGKPSGESQKGELQDQSGIPQTGMPSREPQEGELQDQSGIPQTGKPSGESQEGDLQEQSVIPQTGMPSGEHQEGELQDQSGIPQTGKPSGEPQEGENREPDAETQDPSLMVEDDSKLKNNPIEDGINPSSEISSLHDDLQKKGEEHLEESLGEDKSISAKQQIDEFQALKDELESHREEIDKEGIKNHTKEQIIGSSKIPEESIEEQYTLGDQANKFLEQLGELPSFKNRDRGPGYSIDTRGYTQVPDSVIRTLITKFLNQRFCKRDTDLNVRSNSLDETQGFFKWKVRDVIVHLETEQITKVLTDKFGYQYANGKNENVPLSFYFDLSGSMSNYTNLLAVIAIELLKKGVKVLVGYNERVNVQIDKIDGSMTVSEFAKILSTAGYTSWLKNTGKLNLQRNPKVTIKFIDRNIDNYLIEKKAEKCVAFSDFDAIVELSNLSQRAQVYYFCFESDFSKADLGDFKGFVYQVENIKDIENGLVKVNTNRFETLCYTEKAKGLKKKLGE